MVCFYGAVWRNWMLKNFKTNKSSAMIKHPLPYHTYNRIFIKKSNTFTGDNFNELVFLFGETKDWVRKDIDGNDGYFLLNKISFSYENNEIRIKIGFILYNSYGVPQSAPSDKGKLFSSLFFQLLVESLSFSSFFFLFQSYERNTFEHETSLFSR
jgi:hypothetical protein